MLIVFLYDIYNEHKVTKKLLDSDNKKVKNIFDRNCFFCMFAKIESCMNWKKFFKVIKNKYFITGFLFVMWMLFFDESNLFATLKYKKELENARKEKVALKKEINYNSNLLLKLKSDRNALRQFAREQYLMKKDNETVFLIIPEKEK